MVFALDIPDTTLDAYWATTAQILAVLALAMVVEARALQRQWKKLPIWFQLLQALVWFFFLAALAILLPSVIEASRPDRSQPEWMPRATNDIITWSVSVLVLSPGLTVLITGSAGFFYAIKGFFSPLRWRIWRDKIRLQKVLKQHNEQVSQIEYLINYTSDTQKKIEDDRKKYLTNIRYGVQIMRNMDMTSEYAGKVMDWIEGNAIRVSEAAQFIEETKRVQDEFQYLLRESSDSDEQFLTLIENKNKSGKNVKSILNDLARVKAEIFRNSFDQANSGSSDPPKS